MHKNKQILTRAKKLWRRHGALAVACTCGFIVGWSIAIRAPLGAYLLRDVTMQRFSSVSSPAIRQAVSSSRRRTRPVFRVRQFPVRPPVTRTSSSSSRTSRSAASMHRAAPAVTAPQTSADKAAKIVPAVAPPLRQSSSLYSSSSSHSFTPPRQQDMVPGKDFPAFDRTVFPVSQVPNWGAMHAAAEWNRTYDQMTEVDFVATPSYDLQKLSMPFKTLVAAKDEEEITRKLFYSTKFLGKYDLDAGEYSGHHPGVDMKLAPGTPIGSIAGGRVQTVGNDDIFGIHVIIEHRVGAETFYSIYGHFAYAGVREGQAVTPGQFIGTVGSTGSTTGPHLHLQVDKGRSETRHVPYAATAGTSAAEALKYTVNPIQFIQRYAGGM
ncbi:MAG: M23 family metallopeptidase [Candidatus Peribacteraceae bacterium]|nr:M23 family metallopeptidase [Candidatus Peribacteraceae bacterium]